MLNDTVGSLHSGKLKDSCSASNKILHSLFIDTYYYCAVPGSGYDKQCVYQCVKERRVQSENNGEWEEQRLVHHPARGQHLAPGIRRSWASPDSTEPEFTVETSLYRRKKWLITHPLVPGLWA